MGCLITQGRDRVCKDLQGGIKDVYIFPFVKYSRSQIVRTDLTLTSFPSTDIFKFEALEGANFEQRMNNDDGRKYYDQSITLQFSGMDDSYALQQFLKQDQRIIIVDRNGIIRMLGAYNGLVCESISSDTGSNKASFSGFTVEFKGQETEEALFLNQVDVPDIEIAEFLLLEDGTFIVLENPIPTSLDEYIILEN